MGLKFQSSHFQFLSFGNSINFILLSPHVCITRCFVQLASCVFPAASFFIIVFFKAISLVLKISIFTKKRDSLFCFFICNSLLSIQSSNQCRLSFKKQVSIAFQLLELAKEISIFRCESTFASFHVSKGEIGFFHLFVHVIQISNKISVRLLSRGLGTADFICSSTNIGNFSHDQSFVFFNFGFHFAQLVNLFRHFCNSILLLLFHTHNCSIMLNFSLFKILAKSRHFRFSFLVQLNLCSCCTRGFIKTLSQAFHFSCQIRTLSFSLCSGLTFSFKFLFHFFNSAQQFFNGLLSFPNKALFIIKFAGHAAHFILFPHYSSFKFLFRSL